MFAKVLILTAFLSSSGIRQLTAQSKIEGNIADGNGRSLSNATVLLMSAKDSSLVKGTMTNGTGAFTFENISGGHYILSSSFTGYADVYSGSFSVSEKEQKHVGTLTLNGADKLLTNVTVSAKKPLYEQSVDKLTINVASSITSAGYTALDVLARSPGITVDKQNNNISMNGKDGVVIIINGRVNRVPVSTMVQMLAGMSAANIEKIELITTPPANYDAEGNAGFINIVMKRNTQYGTNGSWSATAGYGKRWKGMASLNFNHRQGKWNMFGDYSLSRVGAYLNRFFYRTVVNGSRTLESIMEQNRDQVRINQNGRFGIDYELNNKTTIGVLLSGLGNTYSMHEHNSSHILVNNSVDTIIDLKNKENHPLLNYAVNLNLLHQFTADQRVTVNLDHMYYTNDNVIDYMIDYYDGSNQFIKNENTNSIKKTPITFWVASVDYAKKINDKLDLETGVKGTISNFTNDVKVERMKGATPATDQELTSKYYLDETIGAAYGSLQVKLTDKTNAKVGLRFEYTSSNLRSDYIKNIVDRDYGRLFPVISVSQVLDKNNSLNLSYNRRITRPTFDDMAPFVYFIDPNTFFSGNPALQPSVSDAIKGDYIFKRFIFSLSYTHDADPITNFAPKVDPVRNKQTLSSENQKSRNTWALTIAAPVNVSSWWTMQNNLTAVSQLVNAIYKAQPLQLEQKYIMINTTQSFVLPKSFSMELNAYYQSGGMFGVYKVKAMASLDFGLQKKLGKKGGTLRLNVSDVFGPPHMFLSVNAPEQNLVTSADLYFSNRTLQLTYTRSFGNEKVRSSRNRTTGAEAEKQRVNTN